MSYAHHSPELMKEARRRLLAGEGVRPTARALGLPPSTVSLWNSQLDSPEPGDDLFEYAASEGGDRVTDQTGLMLDQVDLQCRSNEFGSASEWEIEALRVPSSGNEGDWQRFGFEHPCGRIGPEQSARVFRDVATGVPIDSALRSVGLSIPSLAADRELTDWRACLRVCQQWIIARLARRVAEGMAGWKGAASLLALLDPANFATTHNDRASARRMTGPRF